MLPNHRHRPTRTIIRGSQAVRADASLGEQSLRVTLLMGTATSTRFILFSRAIPYPQSARTVLMKIVLVFSLKEREEKMIS